jgi:hypothetical protein
MGLTTRKEDQLKKMPLIETKMSKSKDGRLLIHKTIITDIKPAEYYKAVMESVNEGAVEEAVEEA